MLGLRTLGPSERFVPMDVLYHRHYVSGCFVLTDLQSAARVVLSDIYPSRCFVSPNVLSLDVISPDLLSTDVMSGHNLLYILSQISYKFSPVREIFQPIKRLLRGFLIFYQIVNIIQGVFSNISLNEQARIIYKNISDRVLHLVDNSPLWIKRAQRLSFHQISEYKFRVELKDFFRGFR